MRRGPDYLFVYGSLRPALKHPLQRRLDRHAVWVGEACCSGRLYDLGRYPGLVSDSGKTESVRGDLFRLCEPDALLRVLDRYEGCAPRMPKPREFYRTEIEVVWNDQVVTAWIYLYGLSVRGKTRIASGDYLCRSSTPADGR